MDKTAIPTSPQSFVQFPWLTQRDLDANFLAKKVDITGQLSKYTQKGAIPTP